MSTPLSVSVRMRYRLERLLGQGGMGSVYRAYDRLTGQHVALKLVHIEQVGAEPADAKPGPPVSGETQPLSLERRHPESDTEGAAAARRSSLTKTVAAELRAASSGRASRVHIAVGSARHRSSNALWARLALAQEFRTLASVRHPHIISVLDYGFAAKSQPFFTMELLENARTLDAARQGLSLQQQALLLTQLLGALSYLHRHGILHRDLKPANVMVLESSEGPQLKLLDFGLARARSHGHVRSGELLGTLSYMAPELFEGKPASEAADLFAVGVIAYELFTRRHPFDQGDDGDLIEAVLRSEPSWERLRQHAELAAVLRRLLAKSPAERPSADEALISISAAAGIPVPQETAALRESTLQAARFVGREEPMALLRAALDSARSGRGAVQLIAGESGVGKSRLMEELRVYALVQGVLSARGQAVSEGSAAYSVWQEILRTLCLTTELDAFEASVLKSVLPELETLLERTISDAPVLDPRAGQLRLVNVIEALLMRQSEPLLLLFEDVHWADAESLALMRHLAPLCRTRPILMLASYRDDERPTFPQELPGSPVLKLQRLSAASITELCKSMLGETGYTPELVAFLESETEGNRLLKYNALHESSYISCRYAENSYRLHTCKYV